MAQTRLFDRTCKILNADRLGRLAIANHHNEPMLRRILVLLLMYLIKYILLCAFYFFNFYIV